MAKPRLSDPDKPSFDSRIERRRAPEPVDDEQWQAVIRNDPSYDGRFYYAVKTTGIFCRPSCKSKPPNRDNIGFFRTANEAMAAKFRPCKRCRPAGQRLPDEEWIALAAEHIDRSYKQPLTLAQLAAVCHGTPYHLHRTFKKVRGLTPVQYMQSVRIAKAKEALRASAESIAKIGESVGLPNLPYFITLFKRITGCTPARYRQLANSNDEGGPST